jgi:protein O-GlcNAc transferase
VSVEPQQLFAEHAAFGEQFEVPLRAGWPAHTNSKDPARVLHVGFVSGDLYDHAVASFLEPVLKHLVARHTLTLHAYYTHSREDAVTLRLRSYFAHWHAVPTLSDADLAHAIRADGIDILIDLSGHTAYNRLRTFAHKPAPLQVSWIGYPGTTGLQAIDYYLCERYWLPPGQLDWQFTEKLAYLPAGIIFQPSAEALPINALPALVQGHITFGSFNRPNKINDSVIVLWSMLLRSLPSARMLLGGIAPDSQQDLIQTFALAGIESDRLTFYPRSTMADYLALHHQVDICLDTFPYGGGTTTLHAAWMGVPTLTLTGETPASRAGAALMNQLDLSRFSVTDIDDFVSQGLYWAEHLADLADIRQTMRQRFKASAMGQPERFADSLDATLRAMWLRWCRDLPPVLIEVDAVPGAKVSTV